MKGVRAVTYELVQLVTSRARCIPGEKLLALQSLYQARPIIKGPKTPIEDAMVGYYPHCTFNLNPRPASIDTPLHSFIPARHVDHTHPNAIISIAASRRSKEITKEVFGEEVGWTPWLRPGFELGLEMQRMYQDNPKLSGIVLGQHGLINWADSNRECYELTLTHHRTRGSLHQRPRQEGKDLWCVASIRRSRSPCPRGDPLRASTLAKRPDVQE